MKSGATRRYWFSPRRGGRGVRVSRLSRGFTLVEMLVALAISGILIASTTAAISLSLFVAPREGGKLAVENEHQSARYWLTRDADSAESFTALTSPQYGSLTWRDFRGLTTDTYVVTYYYNSTLKALMREEKKNGVVQSTVAIARNILQESHVTFTWSPGTRKLTVAITPTLPEAPALGDISRSGTVVAFLRYEAEPVVSPPSYAPIPTPPPGSVTYYVAAQPTIITGTYVSGNAASLQNADTDFYVVAGVNVTGIKWVVWQAASQTMTTPATINQLEVRFTGKSTKAAVAMEFFVKGSGGYGPTADSSFFFTQADTETTHIFYLDSAKLSYVNSTRVVELKVQGAINADWDLYTNQVLFIASP